MFIYRLIILAMSLFLLGSCGQGVVEVTNESYEEKIVIEGFLQANSRVKNIRITRNFPVNYNLQSRSILPNPSNTTVLITDVDSGRQYDLDFHYSNDNNFENYYWEYTGNDFVVQPGKTYSIDVETEIEGKTITARAQTTVPQIGLNIEQVSPKEMVYRERDLNGDVKIFDIGIERSPGTDFYIMSVTPLVATPDNFIYDNPFVNLDKQEVEDELDDFSYEYFWMQDTPLEAGVSTMHIYWFDLWFYTEYQVIVYAADNNYKEFLLTYNDVQEDDGNFHEPLFNIEGEGIGVFASVIADTTTIRVVRE